MVTSGRAISSSKLGVVTFSRRCSMRDLSLSEPMGESRVAIVSPGWRSGSPRV